MVLLKIIKILLSLLLRKFWFNEKNHSKNSLLYSRRLPPELIDESLKFFPYIKCVDLSFTTTNSLLKNLAQYRAKKAGKKATSLQKELSYEAWILAKFLGFFRLSLVRKIFAMLDAQTSANILLHMDELKRAQILRGLDTRKSANILFRMMPADLEIAAKTLRSPFLEANKQAQIIAAITLIDQGRAEVIRAPLRRVRSNELLPAALFPQHTIAELRAEFAAQRAEFAAQRDEFAAQLARERAEFAAQIARERAEFAAQLAQQQKQIHRIARPQITIATLQLQIDRIAHQLAQQQAQSALHRAALNNRIFELEETNRRMEVKLEDQNSSWVPIVLVFLAIAVGQVFHNKRI